MRGAAKAMLLYKPCTLTALYLYHQTKVKGPGSRGVPCPLSLQSLNSPGISVPLLTDHLPWRTVTTDSHFQSNKRCQSVPGRGGCSLGVSFRLHRVPFQCWHAALSTAE